MVAAFWLVAKSGSVRVRVPVPTLTTAPVGVLASVEPFQPPSFQPWLLSVRPAKLLLPTSVRVDWPDRKSTRLNSSH